MFELEEVVSYKVFGREFSNKEDALKYSKILQNRQNLFNKPTHSKEVEETD